MEWDRAIDLGRDRAYVTRPSAALYHLSNSAKGSVCARVACRARRVGHREGKCTALFQHAGQMLRERDASFNAACNGRAAVFNVLKRRRD